MSTLQRVFKIGLYVSAGLIVGILYIFMGGLAVVCMTLDEPRM